MTSSSTPDDLVVLVVDDEAAVAEQLAAGLQLSGFAVRTAHGATEALDMLRAAPEIAVVLSDLRMPGGDGVQLAEAIRSERNEAEAVEIILITGHATVDAATAAMRSGVTDFVRKPFRLGTAAEAVRRAMARAAGRRAHQARLTAMEQRLEDGAASRTMMGSGSTQALHDHLHAVSHALRTPLNAISASAEMLGDNAEAAGGEDYQAILRKGITEATRAIRLVEELLLVEAREPADPKLLDLAVMLRVALQAAARPGIRIHPPEGEPSLPVLAQPEACARALQLIVEAAIDWSPDASLRARVERCEEEGLSWACVTLVVGEEGDWLDLPATCRLPTRGSRFSRTIESLGFLVVRRLLERQGGWLTSWLSPAKQGVLRLALPLPAESVPSAQATD